MRSNFRFTIIDVGQHAKLWMELVLSIVREAVKYNLYNSDPWPPVWFCPCENNHRSGPWSFDEFLEVLCPTYWEATPESCPCTTWRNVTLARCFKMELLKLIRQIIIIRNNSSWWVKPPYYYNRVHLPLSGVVWALSFSGRIIRQLPILLH